MKKLFSLLLTLCMALSVFAFAPFVSKPIKTASAASSIDVYFIAGQSNGSGYTNYTTGTHSNGTAYVGLSSSSVKPEHTSGYPNIYYFGNAMRHDSKSGIIVNNVNTTVKKGFGAWGSCIGAELGMAEELSKYYNATSGKKAIIIKYAAGSASLDGGSGASWGNWCPPSKLASGEVISVSGGENLYDNFFTVIEDAYNKLFLAGYSDINFKGLFWAQGEAESGNALRASKYGSYLEAFINDFRSDLFELTSSKGKTFTDYSVLDLPFAIAEICPTFGVGIPGDTTTRPYVAEVARQEKAVCDKMSNVHLISTKDYVISAVSDANGNRYNPGCYDNAHYSADDMYEIGQKVGASLYTAEASKFFAGLVGDVDSNTKLTTTNNDDGSVTVSWTLGEERYIDKIELNGNTVTATGNSYVIPKTQVDAGCSIVVFVKKEVSMLNVTTTGDISDSTNVNVVKNDDGSRVVSWTTGTYHRVSKITINGEEVSVNGYTYTFTAQDLTSVKNMVIEFEKYKSNLTVTIPSYIKAEVIGGNNMNVYENGSVVKFKLYWDGNADYEGYKLRKVLFNNEEIHKDNDGYYTITITDESTFRVQATKLTIEEEYDGGLEVFGGSSTDTPPVNPDPPTNPTPPVNPDNSDSEGGCKSFIGVSESLILFIVVLASATFVVVRKKFN